MTADCIRGKPAFQTIKPRGSNLPTHLDRHLNSMLFCSMRNIYSGIVRIITFTSRLFFVIFPALARMWESLQGEGKLPSSYVSLTRHFSAATNATPCGTGFPQISATTATTATTFPQITATSQINVFWKPPPQFPLNSPPQMSQSVPIVPQNPSCGTIVNPPAKTAPGILSLRFLYPHYATTNPSITSAASS